MFLAAALGNLIIWSPLIVASLLVAYLTDISFYVAGPSLWFLLVAACITFGIARWAVRKARRRAD